jgi:hypothetical protein
LDRLEAVVEVEVLDLAAEDKPQSCEAAIRSLTECCEYRNTNVVVMSKELARATLKI